MPLKFRLQTLLSVLLGFLALLPAGAFAQTADSQSRITQQVNESQRTVLSGNTHPLAQAKYDKGVVSASLPLDRMSLVLKRSPAQEVALQTLLAQQQDKNSPNYHKWLTAAQFGQLFGPSEQDIQKVTAWLTTHGFIVDQVATGRQFIQFSGTAGEVEEAFKAPLHNLSVNGKPHIANMTDPSIPTALASVVGGVRSLHDFFPKAQNHAKVGTRARPTSAASVKPKFTFPSGGTGGCNVLGSNNCFGIGPADLATIYSIPTTVDGTGVTIDIMADSNINLADVSDFQSQFGLPMKAPTVIVPPGSSNPGLLAGPAGDEIEAILDVEWAGAVAHNATINLIVSKSSNTTFGGDLDAEYVVDLNSPPPILSESFGECELGLGTSGNTFYNNLWTQGAAEGITIIISSGDNGSAGCDVQQVDNSTPTGAAQLGLAVNGVASTGANVAVGGTDFNDLTNPLTYWAVGNNPVTLASALSYIPESTWNDSCTNAVFINEFNGQFGNDAQTVCNNATIVGAGLDLPVGGSGGKSACTTSDGSNPSSCGGGNTKPTFQNGVTTDTTRDIPDISLFAGDGEIAASFYIVCERDFSGDGGAACNLDPNVGPFLEVGGTSVSTQVFAGVMALVIQNNALGRQGNPDTVLYSLAKAEFAANCNTNNPQPHSTCVFNDVTTGTIAMPCVTSSPQCTTNASVVPPAVRVNRPTPTTLVTLVCALGVGLMLICFRGRSHAWTTALVFLAAVAFTANAGCGGGGNGGGVGGGGGGTPAIGLQNGYSASTGYDLATGLGSVNVENLIAAHGFAAAPDVNPPPTTPVAPALLRQMDVRDWQPAVRAIAITFVFCLGIVLLGFRQRSRRLNAAMVLTAIALLTLTAGIARFHGYAPHAARPAESLRFALTRR
ncbi:MAG: S53 family peptidase [Candidatus Acidiferrales bacterium]